MGYSFLNFYLNYGYNLYLQECLVNSDLIKKEVIDNISGKSCNDYCACPLYFSTDSKIDLHLIQDHAVLSCSTTPLEHQYDHDQE
jgi:Zn-finger protein